MALSISCAVVPGSTRLRVASRTLAVYPPHPEGETRQPLPDFTDGARSVS